MNDLNKFIKDIGSIAYEYPLEAEKHLQTIGNRFKKIIREKSPDSGKNSKRKLKKSWKSKLSGYKGSNLQIDIWSTSPHFHLQDRGHVQTDRNGKPLRFIQGKHFLASTCQEVESTVIPSQLDKFIADIEKKIEKG